MDAFSFYIILNAFASVKRFSPFSFAIFSILKKDGSFSLYALAPWLPLERKLSRKPTDEGAPHPLRNFTAVIINELAPRSRNPPTEAPKFSVLPPLMMQQVFSAALRIGCRNDSPHPTGNRFPTAAPEKLTIPRFFASRKNYKDFMNPLDFPKFSGRMMQEILPKIF